MAAPCEHCGTVIHRFKRMVMLHDELWQKVSQFRINILCDRCIEKILGRKLTINDLKPDIPINMWYIQDHIDKIKPQRLAEGDIAKLRYPLREDKDLRFKIVKVLTKTYHVKVGDTIFKNVPHNTLLKT